MSVSGKTMHTNVGEEEAIPYIAWERPIPTKNNCLSKQNYRQSRTIVVEYK